MSEHLAGPWALHHQPESQDFQWSLQNDDTAFLLFNFHPDVPDGVAKATANLVGAALDMYTAIEQALDDMGDTGLSVCEQAKQDLRAALAKAEGQS